MPAPYMPINAFFILIISIIAIVFGIVYSVRVSKRFKPDDPRLKWRIHVAAILIVIPLIPLIGIISMAFTREFIDPKKAIEPVPGQLTGLIQEFITTPFEETSYINMSMAGWFAGFAVIVLCLRWWPYARISKKITAEDNPTIPITAIDTTTRRSKRHLDPNAGYKGQSPVRIVVTRSLRILIPVLIVTSTFCIFTADHIKNNPTFELIAAKKQALTVQTAIHEVIYSTIPDEAAWIRLHNPPTPYAEGVIGESRTPGRHSRPNGQEVGFSRIPQTSIDPFIGDDNKGRNANWQTLRWAQAVAYGLKPQVTVVHKDSSVAYYEASYDSSGSIVFTPISTITHLNE